MAFEQMSGGGGCSLRLSLPFAHILPLPSPNRLTPSLPPPSLSLPVSPLPISATLFFLKRHLMRRGSPGSVHLFHDHPLALPPPSIQQKSKQMSLLLEYPNLLDERQSAKLFNGAFVLSQLFGCCAVVFVAIWMGGEGGFAWRKDPDRQFHYHPTFMAMGLLFLQGEAILVYRVFRNERKRVTKLLHMSIHSVALLLAVVALKAVWDSHDLHRSPEGELQPLPNLYSLHSWLGISVVSFYFVQFIGGFLTFFFPGASVSLRKCLLPFHQLFGLFIFLCCSGTALLGISEYAAWHHGCWTVDHNLCAQHLVSNLFGLSLIGYCFSVLFLVVNPRWKRKPLPEEECLNTLVGDDE